MCVVSSNNMWVDKKFECGSILLSIEIGFNVFKMYLLVL